MPDVEPAVSSTATEEAPPTPAIESWSAAERDKWLSTGEVPTTAAKEPPEPAAPEQETSAAEEAGSPAPDSETGKQQEPKKRGISARKAELDAEIQELREALRIRHELREQVAQPAETKPAAPAPATAEGEPIPPDIKNWTGTYEELDAANREYVKQLVRYTATQQVAEAQRAAEERARQEQQGQKWRTAASAELKVNPAFQEAINVIGEFATRAGVADLIKDSDVGVDLVKHLWDHDQEGLRILTLGNKVAIARELGRIEAQLSAGKNTPEPKKVSSASRPPTELSGTSAAVEDEAEAALKAGDFARYARAQNAKDAKSRR